MNMPSSNLLASGLRDFFTDHLPRLRGTSPHTILSYRDTFKLLLAFAASQLNRAVVSLDLNDLGPDFLQHLEEVRKNKASTRNIRLAAIHNFFRYLATQHPDRVQQWQRVLSVPFKRSRTQSIDYLDYHEIQALLTGINRDSLDRRRDYTLLVTMFNTGARVQEILDLRPCDLQLANPLTPDSWKKGGRSASVPSGRRPPNCCVRSSANAALSRLRFSVCSEITMARP